MTGALLVLLIAIDVAAVAAVAIAAFGPPFAAGRYRWFDDPRTGPAPIVHFAIHPYGSDFVRVEAGIRGRCVYLHWGSPL